MLTSFSHLEFHLAGLTEPLVILCSSSDHSSCGRFHGPRQLYKTLRLIYSDYQTLWKSHRFAVRLSADTGTSRKRCSVDRGHRGHHLTYRFLVQKKHMLIKLISADTADNDLSPTPSLRPRTSADAPRTSSFSHPRLRESSCVKRIYKKPQGERRNSKYINCRCVTANLIHCTSSNHLSVLRRDCKRPKSIAAACNSSA